MRVNDQIHLSEIKPADKDALLLHLQEKEIYDRTLRIPYPYTEDDADAWLGIMERTTRERGQPIAWAIRDSHDLLIGSCGFDRQAVCKSHLAEIGFWLAKPYWGQGIMTNVVKTVCRYGFDELGLSKITAHVFADNTGSARVLEKCGFEREGYLRQQFKKDGRLIDGLLYGLLK